MPAPVIGGALALGGALIGKKKGGGEQSSGGGSSVWPEILPSVISAGGSLAGAALGSRAQNKATSAQSQATAEALAYQKELDAQHRADWQAAMQQYDANRRILAQHLGIDIGPATPTSMAATGTLPGGSSGGQGGVAQPVMSAAVPGSQVYGQGGPSGQTIGDMIQPSQWKTFSPGGFGKLVQ